MWANDNKKFKKTFDKVSLDLIIKLMLDNYFFNFGNLSIQQIVGIAISFYPASFSGNLHLYYYENK